MVATISIGSLMEVKRTRRGQLKLVEAGGTEQISNQANADQETGEQDEGARCPFRSSQRMYEPKCAEHESPYGIKCRSL